MPLTRRATLGLLSGSTFFLSATGSVATQVAPGPLAPRPSFPQGVASGDPRPHAVMLWTRAQPADDDTEHAVSAVAGDPGTADNAAAVKIPLLLQVSEDSDFNQPLLQAQIDTDADSDYTVRAYVDGLTPDTIYYYRFLGSGGSYSRTGRTRTAPAAGQERTVKLAFASCQNYEQGYFGSWARMLQDDLAAADEDQIQFVLHLGDFIYERSWPTRSDGSQLSRRLPDFPDGAMDVSNRHAVSLADYRHLYRVYLSDPLLQEARARWPFICTWDDHEFSNDNYQSYSTYEQEAVLDAPRKQASNQAWFEYIPSVLDELESQPAHNFQPQQLSGGETAKNQAALDSLRIYRKLSWGSNLDIVLTDSRSYRSPPCLAEGFAQSLGLPMNTVELVEIADAGSAYAGGQPPATLPYGSPQADNPARQRAPGTLLGTTQRDWLQTTLTKSEAPWKLWGNALPLIPMRLDMSSVPFAGYQDSIFNIDAWPGYPHEQELLMSHLERQGISGLVSLSGDHHMHGAGTINNSASDPQATPVCVDFTVAGISSTPLFEELVQVARRDHPDFQPLVYREQGNEIIPVWNMSMLRGVVAAYAFSRTGLKPVANWLGPNRANPGLQYVDTHANGYGLAQFSKGELRVDMITMADCKIPFEQAPPMRHRASFRLKHWQTPEPPVLQGPAFDGPAPFPFTSLKV